MGRQDLLLVSCLVALLAPAVQVGATPLFVDDFNRGDSPSVDGGWFEDDGGCLNSFIASSALEMRQHGCPTGQDGQNTRVYRLGSSHANIILSGTFMVSMGGPADPQFASGVAVRSDGTADSGLGFDIGTNLYSTPDSTLRILDDGAELIAADISIINAATYEWEMLVSADNHVAIRVWSDVRPSSPTLEFTNDDMPYTPLSSGNFWQIEVTNRNNTTGPSHEHGTIWDDFAVAMIPEPSTALLLATGLMGLALRRRLSA